MATVFILVRVTYEVVNEDGSVEDLILPARIVLKLLLDVQLHAGPLVQNASIYRIVLRSAFLNHILNLLRRHLFKMSPSLVLASRVLHLTVLDCVAPEVLD